MGIFNWRGKAKLTIYEVENPRGRYVGKRWIPYIGSWESPNAGRLPGKAYVAITESHVKDDRFKNKTILFSKADGLFVVEVDKTDPWYLSTRGK